MKVVVLIWVALILMLSGCNTMEGLNKDLKKGGDKVRKVINS